MWKTKALRNNRLQHNTSFAVKFAVWPALTHAPHHITRVVVGSMVSFVVVLTDYPSDPCTE